MTSLRLMGDENFVKNNTIHKTAASSTLNSENAPIIEYNDLWLKVVIYKVMVQ